MVSIKLKGVQAVRKKLADGTKRVYYYHRATREKLPDDPTSGEFIARVTELNRQMAEPPRPGDRPGSIGALITHYKSHKEFTSLAPKSRSAYSTYLDIIRDAWGGNAVANIDREAVLDLRDAYQDTPRTANYLIAVLRRILDFALDRPSAYHLTHNPAARPKKLKTGDGHRPWEEGEIEAFRVRWRLGTIERTIFEIGLNTGQRGEDIAAMERIHIGADGTIAVAQEKTKARVWLPQSSDLREALAAWDNAQARKIKDMESAGKPVPLAMKRRLLTSTKGGAFKVDHFRHVMIGAYKAVDGLTTGLDAGGVTTHGLRYTAATILHELGCDWDTIASITGHETITMVRKYTAKKRKAKIAITRLDQARQTAGNGTERNQP